MMLGSPLLTTLHLGETKLTLPSDNHPFRLRHAVRLERISVPLWSGATVSGLAGPLLTSAKATLRYLELYEVVRSSEESDWTLGMKGPLVAVAPQLLYLGIGTQPPYDLAHNDPRKSTPAFDSALVALRDVRSLSLTVYGFNFPALFPHLQQLNHLHTLSISDEGIRDDWEGFRGITSKAVIDFLVRSPSILNLTLPSQLEESWGNKQMEKVQKTARDQGVEFELRGNEPLDSQSE